MADKNKLKAKRLQRRKYSIRHKIVGTSERPRLSVFPSGKHIYAQVIDDMAGRTLASAGTLGKSSVVSDGSTCNVDAAKAVGKAVAEKAKAAGVTQIAFDRNGRRYHGRVKALADAAREEGLQF
ncbi:MAG: 50S ribosomal protein L18 [Planctomycetota bacterium]